MFAGKNGVLNLANVDPKTIDTSEWKKPPVSDSGKRLSHQLSIGDLHLVNHKESQDSSVKNNDPPEVTHNYKDQVFLNLGIEIKLYEKDRTHNHGTGKDIFRPAVVLSAWFFCSFVTIMLNKYILSTLDADPGLLGEFQIVMTTVFGFIAMHLPCNFLKPKKEKHPENYSRIIFIRSMVILGLLRFGSVVSSVVAMKNVAISFSETIKSSAPLFTVITAYFILGEYSGIYVSLSLIPIMFGLGICTSNEISFVPIGFFSALLNNVFDW
eukprot:gene6854-12452_t